MNSFSSQANNAMHLSRYRNPALFVEHSLRPGDGKRWMDSSTLYSGHEIT